MKKIIILFVTIILSQACGNKEKQNDSNAEPTDTAEVSEVKKDIYLLDELLRIKDEKELISIYGEENVSWDTAWYPEGMGTYMVSTLYKNTDDEVSIVWKDTLKRRIMVNAEYMGKYDEVNHQWKTVKWRTSDSLKVGITLSQLESMNGKPVSFSGFGWDYGGMLTSWNGGKFESSHTGVMFAPTNQEDFDTELLGDREFKSTDKVVQADKNKIIVVRIIAYTPQEEN